MLIVAFVGFGDGSPVVYRDADGAVWIVAAYGKWAGEGKCASLAWREAIHDSRDHHRLFRIEPHQHIK